MNAGKYDYEGDWAFCRFDHSDIYAGRIGFGRGGFDARDYGSSTEPSPAMFMLHIEMLTKQGAVLWLATGRYDGRDVVTSPDRLDSRFDADGQRLFHITGWPHMRWAMQSDDGDIAVDMTIDLQQVAILPDAVLPSNTFAMWLSVGRIEGDCRIEGETTHLTGTAFYDHRRIRRQRNDIVPFGYYLYTPMTLADGSQLISYYSHDQANRWRDDYSFALWFRAGRPVTALRSVAMDELKFDADGQPCAWRHRWEAPGVVIEGVSRVQATSIRRVWGGPNAAPDRSANPLFPLAFDSELAIREADQSRRTTGRGLAEWIIHPQLAPRVVRRG